MKSIWMTLRSDRPSPSSRTVSTKLRRTPTGSKIWQTSGTRPELLTMRTVPREEATTWRPEVRSVIIHLRLQPPRSRCDPRSLKLSRRRARTSPSGTAQSEGTSRRPRIALRDAWPTRCSATMPNFAASTRPTRSRSYSRRRPRSSCLRTTGSHTRGPSSASSRRKSLIRMKLIPATYHTYTKTLQYEENC
jgi:hypothetical protein